MESNPPIEYIALLCWITIYLYQWWRDGMIPFVKMVQYWSMSRLRMLMMQLGDDDDVTLYHDCSICELADWFDAIITRLTMYRYGWNRLDDNYDDMTMIRLIDRITLIAIPLEWMMINHRMSCPTMRWSFISLKHGDDTVPCTIGSVVYENHLIVQKWPISKRRNKKENNHHISTNKNNHVILQNRFDRLHIVSTYLLWL